MIYLDNNATTKMDPLVLQEMMPFLTDGYANSASNHSFGVAVSQHIKEARLQIADLIHCEPTEIVFTSGATESINIAIKGIAAQLKDKGNHIITVETEHPAVLDTCEHLAGRGHEITYLKVDNKGLIDLAELEGAIKNTTILISVMFVNNETGVIQPIQEIARIAHEHQILFMSDATQAVGKLPIDVYNWGIDIMAFSAHKFHGPKGVGALFLRNKRPFKVKMPALIHGGGHEMGVRSGTLNVPGIVGMGKAANLARKQMGEGSERIRRYRDRLENTLLAIDHTFVNGDQNLRCHNTTNICFEGADADAIMVGLKEVMVSNGSACTSLSMEPSHVLKAIGLSDQQAFSSLRFSLSRFTTVEEVDRVAQQVAAIVMELRQMV